MAVWGGTCEFATTVNGLPERISKVASEVHSNPVSVLEDAYCFAN